MPLSQEQLQQLDYWMGQHRMNGACPACVDCNYIMLFAAKRIFGLQ